MKTIIKSRSAIAVVAAAVLIAGPAAAANAAATPAPQPNGSPYQVFLQNPENGESVGNGPFAWADQVSLSPLESDTAFNPENYFPAGTDTTSYAWFLSAPGNERNRSQWVGWADLGTNDTHKIWVPTMGLDALSDGDAAGNIKDVQTTGGDFSFGVAFRTTSGLQPAALTGPFVTIHVDAVTGAWTRTDVSAQPATAPLITTQPGNATATKAATATFTAAASGSPTPTVQWKSAAAGSSTFADVPGATAGTLTVAGATLAQSGTQYKAVFTNSAGSVESNVATLTVTDTIPVKPAAGDANQVAITDPAAGVNTVVFPAGIANANKHVDVWAWSEPTKIASNVLADANGNVTVDLAGLAVGAHTLAITDPGSLSVLAWGTTNVTTKSWPAGTNADGSPAETTVTAAVTTSNRFELSGVATNVDLGEVRRGQTTAAKRLGAFTVIDDRDQLPGWSLSASATEFVNGTDVVGKGALGIKPIPVDSLPTGVSVGAAATAAAPVGFADGLANSSTLEAGTKFDADLTFSAPASAKKGTYTSTLTLTLISK